MGVRSYASIALTIFAAIISVPFVNIYQRNWSINPVVQDFQHWRTNTTWIRKTIPTTYYEYGELSTVMPDDVWLHGYNDEGVRLYRQKGPNPGFDIDLSKIKGEIRVKQVRPDCVDKRGAVFGCYNTSCLIPGYKALVREARAEDVLMVESSTSYASFTEFPDSITDELVRKMKDFPLDWRSATKETSFLSNLPERIITAPLHSNPVATSMSIQFVGKKDWLFFDPYDFYKNDGFRGTPMNVVTIPSGAPRADKMEYYLYTSQPGDILFLPANFAHVVATHAGPNIMANLRKFSLKRIIPFGFHTENLIHSLFNMFMFPQVDQTAVEYEGINTDGNEAIHKGAFGVPEKVFNKKTFTQMDALCNDWDPTNIDIKLLELINQDQ
jgi:hypothetical protein